MSTRRRRHALAATACLAIAAMWPAWSAAQTTIDGAWVRGTVAQQKASGLFARITSAQGGRLVSASTPAAGVVEIHQMKMEGDVMRMGAVTALELPAGQAVELKPGGYHVMLMDLKAPLVAGQSVPVTFVVESRDGKRESVEVKAEVRALNAPAAAGHEGHGPHGQHGGSGHKH